MRSSAAERCRNAKENRRRLEGLAFPSAGCGFESCRTPKINHNTMNTNYDKIKSDLLGIKGSNLPGTPGQVGINDARIKPLSGTARNGL